MKRNIVAGAFSLLEFFCFYENVDVLKCDGAERQKQSGDCRNRDFFEVHFTSLLVFYSPASIFRWSLFTLLAAELFHQPFAGDSAAFL